MHAHCSSGGCGNHAPWPCPCPATGNARLSDGAHLVACFQQTQGSLAAEAAFYTQLATPAATLAEALHALGDDSSLHPGHTPLEPESISRLLQALQPQLADLLARSDDFALLHAGLLQHGGPAGLTALSAYDTALRLGLHTGATPDRLYVHAGNERAIATLHPAPTAGMWLDPSTLPATLRALPVAEAELCLSLCADQWLWLATAPTETEMM